MARRQDTNIGVGVLIWKWGGLATPFIKLNAFWRKPDYVDDDFDAAILASVVVRGTEKCGADVFTSMYFLHLP